MSKWVYVFGDGAAEGRAGDRNLLGGKGANLAEMCSLGLPVPPGFTITTEVCNAYYANERAFPGRAQGRGGGARSATSRGIAGRNFGDPKNLLLVSVRSGARASMPGMMDTVLNLGLNDETVEALAADSGDARFAYDSYRRFIQMYSDVVLGLDHEIFEEILEDEKGRLGLELDTEFSAEQWRHVIGLYKEKVEEELGKPFPQDPHEQLWGAIGAVFSSWMNTRAITYRRLHDIPGKLGHRGQRAGHGVRQYGRDLGDRRRLHPQSRRPARSCSTANSWSTRRARTWWPASARRRTSPRRRASTPAPTSRRCRS